MSSEVCCPNCGRRRSLRVGDCQDTFGCIDYIKAQLTEAQRENAAWRALAEWERSEDDARWSRGVSVNRNPDVDPQPALIAEWDYPYEQPDDGHMAAVGVGPTFGAAAISLAAKLGLIPPAAPSLPQGTEVAVAPAASHGAKVAASVCWCNEYPPCPAGTCPNGPRRKP